MIMRIDACGVRRTLLDDALPTRVCENKKLRHCFRQLPVRPTLQAEFKRQRARENSTDDRYDHREPDFLELRPTGLPSEKKREAEAPDDCNLRIEFSSRDFMVTAGQVAHEAAERSRDGG